MFYTRCVCWHNVTYVFKSFNDITCNVFNCNLQQVTARNNANQMNTIRATGQFGPAGGPVAMGQVGMPPTGFNPQFNPNNPLLNQMGSPMGQYV